MMTGGTPRSSQRRLSVCAGEKAISSTNNAQCANSRVCVRDCFSPHAQDPSFHARLGGFGEDFTGGGPGVHVRIVAQTPDTKLWLRR